MKTNLSKYLVRIKIYSELLNILDDDYLADPDEFRKRLTPTLAQDAMRTPKRNGRIRWKEFITFLSDDGVKDLFWVLKNWADEK